MRPDSVQKWRGGGGVNYKQNIKKVGVLMTRELLSVYKRRYLKRKISLLVVQTNACDKRLDSKFKRTLISILIKYLPFQLNRIVMHFTVSSVVVSNRQIL